MMRRRIPGKRPDDGAFRVEFLDFSVNRRNGRRVEEDVFVRDGPADLHSPGQGPEAPAVGAGLHVAEDEGHGGIMERRATRDARRGLGRSPPVAEPAAAAVVGEGLDEEDEDEEEAAEDHDGDQPRVEPDVHEEPDDERGLGARDREGDGRARRAEVDVRDGGRQGREGEEGEEDRDEGPDRGDVARVRAHAPSSEVVVASREVEEREEEDPEDVDEVPVEAEPLEQVVALGREAPPPRRPEEEEEDRDPDDHVERVEPRHREIEREEEPGVLGARPFEREVRPRHEVLDPLVVVLVRLHAEEDRAEDGGAEEEADDPLRPSDLRGADRHRHRERAADQDDRVEGPEHDVELVAPGVEGHGVLPAIERVGEEEPSEEEDLLDEEEPHPERRRLLLLLVGVEVVGEAGEAAVRGQTPTGTSRAARAA